MLSKPPKEPKTFNYPRLYAAFDIYTGDFKSFRIIYPSGHGFWSGEFAELDTEIDYACWARSCIGNSLTREEAIPNLFFAKNSRNKMINYIAKWKTHLELVYIGEIK